MLSTAQQIASTDTSKIAPPPAPPTPPRELQPISHNLPSALSGLSLAYLKEGYSESAAYLDACAPTPPASSPLSSQNDTPTKRTKKVGFCTRMFDHRSATKFTPQLLSHPRRPLRSILKNADFQSPTPNSHIASLGYFPPNEPETIPNMLDSAVKLLSSDKIDLRLDGYQTINGAFKAYSNLPDHASLVLHKDALLAFIIRDVITIPRNASGMNVITQALKLTITLQSIPSIAPALTSEYQKTLLDNALDIVGQPTSVKAITNHFLYLMASQHFDPDIMTDHKADTLVTLLDTVHERVSGTSVISTRLSIFTRLIEQQPALMVKRAKTWLAHIFHGVLSSAKDVRQRAIDTGMTAALTYINDSTVTRAVHDVLATEAADASSYGTYLLARLSDMFAHREHRLYVPQIWGMVILLVHSKSRPITAWQGFRDWLLIIQRCMNNADVPTRHESAIAWNRLVFATHLERPTLKLNEKIVPMLKAPFLATLGRPLTSAYTIEHRRYALHSYCNLIYYALQPAQTWDRLDKLWSEYIVPIIPQLLKAGGEEAIFAINMLKSLLHDGTSVWQSKRANMTGPLRPAELSRLDSKWVRSRLPTILDLLEPHIAIAIWRPELDTNKTALVWPSLLTALVDARRQEVIVSSESKDTLALLINALARLWQQSSTITDSVHSDDCITRFATIVTKTIATLGPMHFAEPYLYTGQMNQVEVALTPSHRASKHQPRAVPAIIYLMHLFLTPTPGISVNAAYFETAGGVLRSVLLGQASQSARLQLIKTCMPTAQHMTEAHTPAGYVNMLLDKAVETAAIDPADVQHSCTALEASQALLAIYEHTLNLAQTSATNLLQAPSTKHTSCLGTLAQRSDQNVEQSASRSLMRPLTLILHEHIDTLGSAARLGFVTYILSQMSSAASLALPSLDLQAIEEELSTALCDLVNACCKAMLSTVDTDGLQAAFVESLAALLAGVDSLSVSVVLVRFQSSLAMLICNESRASFAVETITAIETTWKTVLEIFFGQQHNTLLLQAFSELLVAGFCSTNTAIVDQSVTFWNASFAHAEELSYPARVCNVLSQLRNHLDLVLPAFPDDEICRAMPTFVPYVQHAQSQAHYEHQAQLQADVMDVDGNEQRPILPDDLPDTVGTAGDASASDLEDVTVDTAAESDTDLPTQKPNKRRARHDDSQVVFQDIPSSPLPQADESQHLTGHQQDVRQRQVEDVAPLFPALASSPIPTFARKESAGSRSRSRLQHADDDAEPMTPEQDVSEPTIMLEDALDSSPAPRAATKGKRIDATPATAAKKTIEGHGEYDGSNKAKDHDITANELGEHDELTSPEHASNVMSAIDHTVSRSTRHAQAVAEEPTVPLTADGSQATPKQSSKRTTSRRDESMRRQQVTENDVEMIDETTLIDDATEIGSDEDVLTQNKETEKSFKVVTATSSGSKRKRDEIDESPTPSKKHKRFSPVKELLGRIWNGNARSENTNDADEPIGDCIMVNSQPLEETGTPKPDRTLVEQTLSQPTPIHINRSTVRPKRAAKSSAAKTGRRASNARQSKRAMSSQDTTADEIAVQASPTSDRVTKQATRKSMSSGVKPRAKRSTRKPSPTKVLDAVVITNSVRARNETAYQEIHADPDDTDDMDELTSPPKDTRMRERASDRNVTHNEEEPSSMLEPSLSKDEIAESQDETSSIASVGKSILGKLKDVWHDISRRALGFPEANEIDDMLQNIRKEVMHAERRGRKSSVGGK